MKIPIAYFLCLSPPFDCQKSTKSANNAEFRKDKPQIINTIKNIKIHKFLKSHFFTAPKTIIFDKNNKKIEKKRSI